MRNILVLLLAILLALVAASSLLALSTINVVPSKSTRGTSSLRRRVVHRARVPFVKHALDARSKDEPATCQTLAIDAISGAVEHELLLSDRATAAKAIGKGESHYYQICIRPNVVATISLKLIVAPRDADVKLYVSSRAFRPSKVENDLFTTRSGSDVLTFDTDHWILSQTLRRYSLQWLQALLRRARRTR